jgi:hypothetical protein
MWLGLAALLLLLFVGSGCARSAAGEWTPAKLWALPEANLLLPGSEVIRRHENTGKGFVPESAAVSFVARTSATPEQIAKYFDDELESRGWTGSVDSRVGVWHKGTLTFSVVIGPDQALQPGMYSSTLEGTDKTK